jgi:3',5'-cyclic AMP phosphodiesterase CpdA
MAILNDLHHDSADCNAWFEELAGAVNEVNPDACMLLGDLANKGLESSLLAVRDLFGQVSCPVYTVPGNHDCDVTLDTSVYEKVFPERLNYVVVEQGWQLIFLNTTEGAAWQNTRISEETLSWLENTVTELDSAKPSLVLSHFPLDPAIHMAPLNVDAVWKRLQPLNVRAAFCGHFHGQHQVIRPPLVTTNVCCARSGVRGNFDGDPRKGFWILEGDANTGALDLRLKQM